MSIKEKLMLKGLNIALKVSPDNINLLYDRAFYNLGLNLVDKALEDVEIEREIFWRCMRQHKKMTRKCFKD